MARTRFEEALTLLRELGSKDSSADLLAELGEAALKHGDDAAARSLCEESLALFRETGSKVRIAGALGNLRQVVQTQGDEAMARSLCEEGLAVARQTGGKELIAHALGALGWVLHQQGNHARAAISYRERLTLLREMGDKPNLVDCLEKLAAGPMVQGRPEEAARVFGAAATERVGMRLPVAPADRAEYERDLGVVRMALSEDAFAAAYEAGRALSLEEAIALALAAEPA